jgi:general secretion pathway protein G
MLDSRFSIEPAALAGAPASRRQRRACRSIGNRKSKLENGFSLIEIMIVIVIIGLLAGVVTVNVRGNLIKAKQTIARQDLSVIVDALARFWSEHSRYPTNDEGLNVLWQKPASGAEPYLTKEPVDPWGRSYVYVSPGPNGPFVVICLGADGQEGGEGADADISSDDLPQKATK